MQSFKRSTDFLNDILEQGYAEQVQEHQLKKRDGEVWYIPHHGVYYPCKDKLRVVFNCGVNSQLLQGLSNSLIGFPLKFRQEPIALTADIKSMFCQVRVAEEDKYFLRFLWWPGGDVTQDAAIFRMTVHIFGAIYSPSCVCYALRTTELL